MICIFQVIVVRMRPQCVGMGVLRSQDDYEI